MGGKPRGDQSGKGGTQAIACEQHHDRQSAARHRRSRSHHRQAAGQTATEEEAGDEAPGDQAGRSVGQCRGGLRETETRQRQQHHASLTEAIGEQRQQHQPQALAGEVGGEDRSQLCVAQVQRSGHVRGERPEQRVDQAVEQVDQRAEAGKQDSGCRHDAFRS